MHSRLSHILAILVAVALPLGLRMLFVTDATPHASTASYTDDAAEPTFAPVHVYIDPRGRPLAAWQIEFEAVTGEVNIVGIEGGMIEPFRKPPYYDPRAMMGDRVIIADFSTAHADDLPRERVRIATIHIRHDGDATPRFRAALVAAADSDGRPVDALVTLEE